MRTVRTFWIESKSFFNRRFKLTKQRLSVTMSIFFVLLCITNTLIAQERLSSMPKEKRDSILVEITQKLLKDKFPKWYRKDVHPIITQSDFKAFFLRWLQEDMLNPAVPDYLKPEDLRYTVTLYYDRWVEENFESQYTARATIIDKNQEIFSIMLGNNFGYNWPAIKNVKVKERLSLMPIGKRDSILVEISQKVLKEKYPELYRKDVSFAIEHGDFKLLDIDWARDDKYIYVPKYVDPEDSYYAVTLYYEKWREDKLEYPFTAVVYIIEETQEAYKIMLGSGLGRYESLLKPNKED